MTEISDYVGRFEGTKDLGIKKTFDHIRNTASSDGFTGEYTTLCSLVGQRIGMNSERSRSLAVLGKAYDVYMLLSDNAGIIEELREAFRQEDPFGYMDRKKTLKSINEHLKSKSHKEVNYDLLVYCMYAADKIMQTKFLELNKALLKRKPSHPIINLKQ